jgi:hypothetical protein
VSSRERHCGCDPRSQVLTRYRAFTRARPLTAVRPSMERVADGCLEIGQAAE